MESEAIRQIFSDPGNQLVLGFLATFVENLFPPWPGDAVLLLLLSLPDTVAWQTVLASVAGSIFSGAVLYEVFLRFPVRRGPSRVRLPVGLYRRFRSRPRLWILTSRFMAGIRFFAPIFAGIAGVHRRDFYPAFAAGACLWQFLIWLLAELIRAGWPDAAELSWQIPLSGVLLLGVWLAYRQIRDWIMSLFTGSRR